jgi:hypothetical protein
VLQAAGLLHLYLRHELLQEITPHLPNLTHLPMSLILFIEGPDLKRKLIAAAKSDSRRKKRCQPAEMRCESMNWRTLVAGITLQVGCLGLAPQATVSGFTRSTSLSAETPADKKVLAELEQMVKSRQTYLSVPFEDGKALRLLT